MTDSMNNEDNLPILKLDELSHCIDEAGVTISAEELADPIHHKEKLRNVWLALVRP